MTTSGAALRIGIVCHPAFGGSGIIATEIGLALARRGHQVHFLSHDVPARLARLDRPLENVFFHPVEVRAYPPLDISPYALSLASRLAEIARTAALDLVHVHYAVPHATSAYLARQLLGSATPRVVTTLHGTDVVLVGSQQALLPITRFSLLAGDGITVPSAYLQQAAREHLQVPAATPIEIIPNFVDTERFRPAERRAAPRGRRRPRVLVHSSNFRPLKRVDDVVRIFAEVQRELPARLLLVGDGPERARIAGLVRELGLSDSVGFLGLQRDVLAALQEGDVFLLPSAAEGFGLAALEALACGLPVVASRVGGLPEVVTDGETGLLYPPGEVAAMTAGVLSILTQPARHRRMSRAARRSAEERFQQGPMIARYEDYYRRVLGS